MFNPTQILIDRFVEHMQHLYIQNFGGHKRDYGEISAWAGRMALENIANGDALYHNVEHTMLVTIVGTEMMRGKHMSEGGVTPETWLHTSICLLCHDIGYVKGVCRSDRRDENRFATGRGDAMVELPHGASDASLTPYHVDRGKLFMEERFDGNPRLHIPTLKVNIEDTRFPIPGPKDPSAPAEPVAPPPKGLVAMPDLIRAADLIGQLGDARYLQKLHALFYEFEETGTNKKIGYTGPGDLFDNYPSFYWKGVFPYIQDGIRYLDVTQAGKQILANLYSNVFRREHLRGPDLT